MFSFVGAGCGGFFLLIFDFLSPSEISTFICASFWLIFSCFPPQKEKRTHSSCFLFPGCHFTHHVCSSKCVTSDDIRTIPCLKGMKQHKESDAVLRLCFVLCLYFSFFFFFFFSFHPSDFPVSFCCVFIVLPCELLLKKRVVFLGRCLEFEQDFVLILLSGVVGVHRGSVHFH